MTNMPGSADIQSDAGDARFHPPVLLNSSALGVAEVGSVLEAREVLHGNWPPTRGKWFYAASRACRAAVEGRTSVHVARRIFVEAARESRLHT